MDLKLVLIFRRPLATRTVPQTTQQQQNWKANELCFTLSLSLRLVVCDVSVGNAKHIVTCRIMCRMRCRFDLSGQLESILWNSFITLAHCTTSLIPLTFHSAVLSFAWFPIVSWKEMKVNKESIAWDDDNVITAHHSYIRHWQTFDLFRVRAMFESLHWDD